MESNNGNQSSAGRAAPSEWISAWVPVVLLALIAFGVAWYFVKPAPPNHVVIATGSKSGMYYATASKYAEYFADNGITLEVRETSGTGENYQLLEKPDSGVDIAIVQAGAAPVNADKSHLQAVAGIYLEPVLVFIRGEKMTQLSQLQGKRIAIGAPGSGARLLASLLLNEAGVTDQSAGTTLVDLGGDKAADALAGGSVDAAFYVIAPDVPVVKRLLSTAGVSLMNFDHAHALSRLHPFLSATTLYQGAVDIGRNLPATDIQLVATPATLVVRDTTHSAIVELLVRAAQEINSKTTLLAPANTFPNADGSELPVNHDAKYFLKNSPSILHRTLPFWLASMIDRLIILIVPLLVVLIPLVRMLPVALRYRVERKLLNRYKQTRRIEEQLSPASTPADLQAGCDQLLAMEKELATLRLPIGFAKDLFNLRQHVSFVRERIQGWLQPDPAFAGLRGE